MVDAGSDLVAYCDESEEVGRLLVVAGYLAPAPLWRTLEEPWQNKLREAGLTEFKMVDCHQNTGEFRGRPDRPELRDHFLHLIDGLGAQGWAVRVNLPDVPEIREAMSRMLVNSHNVPFLWAASAVIQFMARDVQPGDRIAFVFDEKDEFRFRALQAYTAMKVDERFAYRDRLGSITFEDSKAHGALQAADTLAYRVRRDTRRGLVQTGPPEDETIPMVKVALLDKASVQTDWNSGEPDRR